MRNSAIARLGVMAFLTLALLVPLAMVQSVVSERASRRDAAVNSVSATWGGPQTLTGPVLTVPYTQVWTDNAGHEQRTTGRAHVLPKDLRFDAVLHTQSRQRGIFAVVVYRTELKVQGRFVRPDLTWVRPVPEQVEWSDASVSIGVSDPRALTRRATITWSGQEEPFTSGVSDVGLFNTGVHAAVRALESLKAGADLPFSYTLELNGTRDIRFMPASEETIVNLTSAWPHPSFMGGRLPEPRTTSATGFTAQWLVPDFGRPYPSRWTSGHMNREELLAKADSSAFGVSLVQPVDIYQQAERAVKYAVLFLVLTFLVFFLWEIFRAALLHPMQYAFVGFALCLFYLLLVSISEHAGFDLAYTISATVTTLVIAGYARAVLHGSRQGASVGVSLAALYGFLYLLLRLEDYALLAGSIGLFVVLATVMYITRRMDWYALRLGAADDRV